jgi:hypothetical protein
MLRTLSRYGYRAMLTGTFLLLAGLAFAAENAVEEEIGELAKAVQNPTANLISLPIQNNTTFKWGANEEALNVTNVQPVFPFELSEDWNLITRTILPIISQPAITPDQDRENGIGDISLTGWLSPAKTGKWIWGVGATLNIPTASDPRLGFDDWALGPSVVVLTMPGKWVLGGLVSNIWDINADKPINFMFSQLFANYNLKDGWYLTSAPIITADWESDSDNRWTIPIGGGAGRVFKAGNQPMNISAQLYYNIKAGVIVGDWSSRIQVQWMFPKK